MISLQVKRRVHINDLSAETVCGLVMHTQIDCCHFRGQGQVFEVMCSLTPTLTFNHVVTSPAASSAPCTDRETTIHVV